MKHFRIIFMLALIILLIGVGCMGSKRISSTDISFTITVIDCTEERPPNAELWAYKPGSWFPNLSEGMDSTVFGTFTVNEPHEIYFYPDGRHGEEMVLVVSGSSNNEKIEIAIYDDKVIASGSAVRGNVFRRYDQEKKPATGTAIDLRVTVFDLTEKKLPNVAIWMHGPGWWYPDLQFGEDSKIFVTLPANEARELYIYPDGQEGAEIVVVVVANSTSGEDTVNIKIYDRTVNIWGTATLMSPIPGNEEEYKRS